VYYTLIGLLSAALVLSVAYLGLRAWDEHKGKELYDGVDQMRDEVLSTTPSTETPKPSQGGTVNPPIEIPPDDLPDDLFRRLHILQTIGNIRQSDVRVAQCRIGQNVAGNGARKIEAAAADNGDFFHTVRPFCA
jgi:hypothetical protein